MTKNIFVVEVTFKYCLSRISTSRIIKLKKCKLQFFSLSCLFSFFDFCLQYLCYSEKVPIKCPRQFLYYTRFICRRACEKKYSLNFMSLVGFQVSKIWKFFWKIYCVVSFKIICHHKQFPRTLCCWIF